MNKLKQTRWCRQFARNLKNRMKERGVHPGQRRLECCQM